MLRAKARAASIGWPVRHSSSAGPAAGQPQQPLGAAEARNQAQVDLGLPKLGRVGSHAQVAGHGQLQAAAEGEAVDHGDDRLAQLLDPDHELLAVPGEIPGLDRAQVVHLGDVGAGDERLGAGAGQHDHPHRGRLGGLLEGLVQFARLCSRFSAFSLSGRFRVISRTAPRSSISRVLKGMAAPGNFGGGQGSESGNEAGASVAVKPPGRYPSASCVT